MEAKSENPEYFSSSSSSSPPLALANLPRVEEKQLVSSLLRPGSRSLSRPGSRSILGTERSPDGALRPRSRPSLVGAGGGGSGPEELAASIRASMLGDLEAAGLSAGATAAGQPPANHQSPAVLAETFRDSLLGDLLGSPAVAGGSGAAAAAAATAAAPVASPAAKPVAPPLAAPPAAANDLIKASLLQEVMGGQQPTALSAAPLGPGNLSSSAPLVVTNDAASSIRGSIIQEVMGGGSLASSSTQQAFPSAAGPAAPPAAGLEKASPPAPPVKASQQGEGTGGDAQQPQAQVVVGTPLSGAVVPKSLPPQAAVPQHYAIVGAAGTTSPPPAGPLVVGGGVPGVAGTQTTPGYYASASVPLLRAIGPPVGSAQQQPLPYQSYQFQKPGGSGRVAGTGGPGHSHVSAFFQLASPACSWQEKVHEDVVYEEEEWVLEPIPLTRTSTSDTQLAKNKRLGKGARIQKRIPFNPPKAPETTITGKKVAPHLANQSRHTFISDIIQRSWEDECRKHGNDGVCFSWQGQRCERSDFQARAAVRAREQALDTAVADFHCGWKGYHRFNSDCPPLIMASGKPFRPLPKK